METRAVLAFLAEAVNPLCEIGFLGDKKAYKMSEMITVTAGGMISPFKSYKKLGLSTASAATLTGMDVAMNMGAAKLVDTN